MVESYIFGYAFDLFDEVLDEETGTVKGKTYLCFRYLLKVKDFVTVLRLLWSLESLLLEGRALRLRLSLHLGIGLTSNIRICSRLFLSLYFLCSLRFLQDFFECSHHTLLAFFLLITIIVDPLSLYKLH